MTAVSQLALAVQLPDDETLDSFCGEEHTLLLNQLREFIEGSSTVEANSNSLYLFGLNGSGKSHLLHASCSFAEQQGFSALCLSLSELSQLSVSVLDGLEYSDLVCLDDIHYIADNLEWQQAVFDLFNRMMEQNKKLIITGHCEVKGLGISLPDLVSRLSWGFTEQIKMLTDDGKLSALQYRAQQRGIYLSEDVAKYLLNHFSRDMGSLVSSLDKLDKASIRAQRKITIPFIKEILL